MTAPWHLARSPRPAPHDYRLVAPSTTAESLSLQKALSYTRQDFVEQTGCEPSKTNEWASYATQFNQLLEEFERTWRALNFDAVKSGAATPDLFSFAAWDGGVVRWPKINEAEASREAFEDARTHVESLPYSRIFGGGSHVVKKFVQERNNQVEDTGQSAGKRKRMACEECGLEVLPRETACPICGLGHIEKGAVTKKRKTKGQFYSSQEIGTHHKSWGRGNVKLPNQLPSSQAIMISDILQQARDVEVANVQRASSQQNSSWGEAAPVYIDQSLAKRFPMISGLDGEPCMKSRDARFIAPVTDETEQMSLQCALSYTRAAFFHYIGCYPQPTQPSDSYVNQYTQITKEFKGAWRCAYGHNGKVPTLFVLPKWSGKVSDWKPPQEDKEFMDPYFFALNTFPGPGRKPTRSSQDVQTSGTDYGWRAW